MAIFSCIFSFKGSHYYSTDEIMFYPLEIYVKRQYPFLKPKTFNVGEGHLLSIPKLINNILKRKMYSHLVENRVRK